MMTNVQRKVLVEESRRGLIIVYACYGNLDENNKDSAATSQSQESDEERVIDVTIPLQYLVEDSQLHLHESSSKSNLLGFYDPCPGEEKKLYIKYLFKDKLHEVTITDTEAIGLPLACKFPYIL
jgi:DnaJ family protein C protein 11